MIHQDFYNTVLSQTFSPCGNYLVVGDICGSLAVFNLSKIVQAESTLTKDDLTPKNRITVEKGFQINCLLTQQSHLLVGGVGEILAYSWKAVKSSKNPQPVWIIDIPNQKDAFERTDVNALQYNYESNHIYAGCGDSNIYVFDLETRKLQKTLTKHTDYIHCLTKIRNDLVSGGEDGIVNIWDLRTFKVSNKIEPNSCEKVGRPDVGKWIGAVSSNEDYVEGLRRPRVMLTVKTHPELAGSKSRHSLAQSQITPFSMHDSLRRPLQRQYCTWVQNELPIFATPKYTHLLTSSQGVVPAFKLCGGGPRLSLWHYRFLTNSTVFPIDDKGIHVAEILNEKILAGGRSKLFYQMTFVGDIISEIPVSAVTIYSAIYHAEPFNVLSIAGSSPKIDICGNFMYKNQQLSLY